MNFSNPIMRFVVGCYFPVLIELLIYEAYLFIKPDRAPDFMLLVVTLPIVLPLIFFYFLSPYLIFKLSSTGEHYTEALEKGIDEIFISEKNVLTPNEIEIVKGKLETALIPVLTRQFRSTYANNYFNQLHDQKVGEYSVLNFYETIYLFSLFSAFFSFFIALVTFYFNFADISIEGFIFAD